jgi:hypothetical protein
MRTGARVYILLFIAILLSAIGIIKAEARTFTAVASGNWVMPKTWSCNCKPESGDNIIIPYGISVSISRPITLRGAVISVAGVLDLTNGLLQMDELDRLTIVPGGKVVANGLGGRINIGLVSHDLRQGAVIEGPATIGSSVLQVALMFFEAEADQEQLTLKWASAGELDVRQYDVVCYHDSVTYEKLGETQGSRYSLKRRDYNFQVANPHGNIEFYRLEAVGQDSTRMVLSTVRAK